MILEAGGANEAEISIFVCIAWCQVILGVQSVPDPGGQLGSVCNPGNSFGSKLLRNESATLSLLVTDKLLYKIIEQFRVEAAWKNHLVQPFLYVSARFCSQSKQCDSIFKYLPEF